MASDLSPGFSSTTHSGAIFSPCRTWRYVLLRCWGSADRPRVAFVALNPSTADERNDDPTVRRMIGFAQDWGYGGLYVLNLFAYRATDPQEMKAARDPVGPDNDEFLRSYHKLAARTVAAWGNHGRFKMRGALVASMLGPGSLWCFGKTGKKQPQHPLYMRKDCPLQRYSEA